MGQRPQARQAQAHLSRERRERRGEALDHKGVRDHAGQHRLRVGAVHLRCVAVAAHDELREEAVGATCRKVESPCRLVPTCCGRAKVQAVG